MMQENSHKPQEAPFHEKLDYIDRRLIRVDKYLAPRLGINVIDLPLQEIFELLKDATQGKLNAYLQEILNDTQVTLKIDNTIENDKESARYLEIKFSVAANVINKYSKLIEMVIGEPLDAVQLELAQDAKKTFQNHNLALHNAAKKQLLDTASKTGAESDALLEKYIQGCNCWCTIFPAPCSKKERKFLASLIKCLRSLNSNGLVAHEIAGGLLFLHERIRANTKADIQALSLPLGQGLERVGYAPKNVDSITPLVEKFFYRAQ